MGFAKNNTQLGGGHEKIMQTFNFIYSNIQVARKSFVVNLVTIHDKRLVNLVRCSFEWMFASILQFLKALLVPTKKPILPLGGRIFHALQSWQWNTDPSLTQPSHSSPEQGGGSGAKHLR